MLTTLNPLQLQTGGRGRPAAALVQGGEGAGGSRTAAGGLHPAVPQVGTL